VRSSFWYTEFTITLPLVACIEWVTNIAWIARTRGCVVDDSAFCVDSASANARIFTFVVDACFVSRTISVKDALRTTPCVGVAEELPHAHTSSSTIPLLTDSVCPTGRRVTWVTWCFDRTDD
jgi:hypothetical protein